MKNNYLSYKINWLKYAVFCLLICPLSVLAVDAHDVVDEQLSKPIEETGVRKDLNAFVGPPPQVKKTRTLTGTVVDGIDNEPVIGANIIIPGAATGVVTDLDGRFAIEIPERGTTLEISYIGYKKQTITITDQGFIHVVLASDNEMLQEVVIVGAGTQKKISVTGAISTVKGSELSTPSSSLTSNLAGKLSGVIARTTTGEPGVASDFYIRGVSTFGGRATPLIMMDGVEISISDLNRIPSETIETFTVLKDASATAIYGARGANGVMLVTTKTGVENQATKVSITLENSFLKPMRQMEYVDGVRWMETYNYAAESRTPGIAPKYTDYDIEMTRSGADPYRYPNVDWQNLMFKSMTMNQRANINISGGGAKVTYYMSLQYNHDTGMLDIPKTYSFNNNINNSTYNFQNNIGYKLSSTTKMNLRMNAQVGNQKGPNNSVQDYFEAIYIANPITFPAYYPAQEDDRHIRFGNAILSGDRLYLNPYAAMLNTFKETNFNTLNISLSIDQDLKFITKGLSVTLLANIKSKNNMDYHRWLQPYYYRIQDGSWDPSEPNVFELDRVGTSGEDFVRTAENAGRDSDQTFYLDARLDYNRNFGDHYVTGMLMYMQREFRDGILPNRNQGVSGRVTYDYGHRYLAEFNFGYNGTERLQKGDRFEFFPAMSFGWVPSNEGFWSPIEDYVSSFKLRGSYGLVGSDETDDGVPHFLYMGQVLLNRGGQTFGAEGNYSLNGPAFERYPVEGACWERVKKLDIGFEAEFFRQVSVNFQYFSEHRERILLRRGAWPQMLGYFSAVPWSNIGEVDNKGIDLSVNWRKEVIKDLHVDVRGNFTYNKNKFVEVDDPAYPYTWQTRTGNPLSTQKGYIAEGYFTSQEEIDNSPTQNLGSPVMVGDLKYRDVNGDGIITEDDMVMISPYGDTPRMQYGLGLNAVYKKIDFGVFFNGSAKRSLMINNMAPFRSGLDNGDRNLMKFIADNYWTPENPDAWYPRLGVSSDDVENNMKASTHWLRNGNFIRFKTLEVGYSFRHCRIYFTGDNLAVWSPFKLWDPELEWYKYPLQRTFNVGVQINF